MESNEKFWLRFWAIVGMVIVSTVIVGSVTMGRGQYRRLASIEKMVAQGYSPIAADCALDPPQSHETAKAFICAEEARKGRQAVPAN